MRDKFGQWVTETCGGKMKYDKKSAVSFINKHPFGDNNKKLRMYKCPTCEGYHITKKQ